MKNFFSRLRYSFGNEDWSTEEQAVNIQPGDRVLCITASGDRPLNLLRRECQKMICLDANPAQNYLLQLKSAAMQNLDHADYLAFLGATPSRTRRQTLRRLFPDMRGGAVQFWSKHEKMVERGILYQGTVERVTKWMAKGINLAQGKKIRRLFAMDDLEEQREFLREEWNHRFWKRLFALALNPLVSSLYIQDPGLINIGFKMKPGHYLYERIHTSLNRKLAKENLLLSLILRGYVSPEAFSPYLIEREVDVIKQRQSVLEIHTFDLLKYLDSLPGPTFDVFSLSDVASYLSYPRFVSLLNQIIRTAKPGARFCLRQFLSSYEIPAHLQPFFIRDRQLEAKLEKEDSCFVYRFLVGTIASL